MTKKHEITITIEGGSGAGKTVLANAVMSGRQVVIETKLASYQAPEGAAQVITEGLDTTGRAVPALHGFPSAGEAADFVDLKLTPDYAATERRILAGIVGTATRRFEEFEDRRQGQYDLECAAEDVPLPSDDDWVMGIRRAAIYRIRLGTGLNILVDHAWNGVTQTTVVPVAYLTAPDDLQVNLQNFLEARDALARVFMKAAPIEPAPVKCESARRGPLFPMTEEELRDAQLR